MKTNQLLEQLQRAATRLDEKSLLNRLAETKARMASETEPLLLLSLYSLESFFEMIKAAPGDDNPEINARRLKAMKEALRLYLDQHAPGMVDFHIFTELVCLYLTIIAQRPRHPNGLFRDGVSFGP